MVRMRINNDSESECKECRTKYKNTEEMYDLMLFGEKNTICKECMEELSRKTLKASCMYNSKLKSKEDMKRIARAAECKNKKLKRSLE